MVMIFIIVILLNSINHSTKHKIRSVISHSNRHKLTKYVPKPSEKIIRLMANQHHQQNKAANYALRGLQKAIQIKKSSFQDEPGTCKTLKNQIP